MAVQVDPIKPMLKAPGTERLKLEYHESLSKFAFNFNLRRYNQGNRIQAAERRAAEAENMVRPPPTHFSRVPQMVIASS
jgi:hypothetical protein